MASPVPICVDLTPQVSHSYKHQTALFSADYATIVTSTEVTDKEICPATKKRSNFFTPIWMINYCPFRVTNVANLDQYPECCLHPYVYRNVQDVKEKCCEEFQWCV